MRSEDLALAPSISKAWGQTKPDLSNDPLSEFVKKSLANYYIINSGLALNKAVRFFCSLLSLLAHTLLGFIMAFFKRNVFIVSASSMALAPAHFHTYKGLIPLPSSSTPTVYTQGQDGSPTPKPFWYHWKNP